MEKETNYKEMAEQLEISGELNALRFLHESLKNPENKFKKKLTEELTEEEIYSLISEIERILSKFDDEYTDLNDEAPYAESERRKERVTL